MMKPSPMFSTGPRMHVAPANPQKSRLETIREREGVGLETLWEGTRPSGPEMNNVVRVMGALSIQVDRADSIVTVCEGRNWVGGIGLDRQRPSAPTLKALDSLVPIPRPTGRSSVTWTLRPKRQVGTPKPSPRRHMPFGPPDSRNSDDGRRS